MMRDEILKIASALENRRTITNKQKHEEAHGTSKTRNKHQARTRNSVFQPPGSKNLPRENSAL